MPKDKVRIALVGCSGHANHSLYPVIHRINEIDLVAVVDKIEEKRLRVQKLFEALGSYADANQDSSWPNHTRSDLDDVTSYSLKTTTIYQHIAGTFRFSVHDFTNRNSSNSIALSNSDA